MSDNLPYPQFEPVADMGVLVEFGNIIDDEVHARVLELDRNLDKTQFSGITEIIPAYASLYVGYDALQTNYVSVSEHIKAHLDIVSEKGGKAQHWQIPTCYEGQYAPDLAELSENLGMTENEVVKRHIEGTYKVYMYGFAPGYAYMGGVPEEIQFSRKQVPQMDVPTGCVMIAGPQCLITTMKMPSGWWVIGRTAKNPLQANSDRPFLFNVGDTIEFVQVSEQEFIKQNQSD